MRKYFFGKWRLFGKYLFQRLVVLVITMDATMTNDFQNSTNGDGRWMHICLVHPGKNKQMV